MASDGGCEEEDAPKVNEINRAANQSRESSEYYPCYHTIGCISYIVHIHVICLSSFVTHYFKNEYVLDFDSGL